jgi:L-amino acid N-acyltransferase YncA
MNIRPAAPSDAPTICAIWNPQIRDTAVTFNSVEKTPSDVVAMMNERRAAGGAFFVAELGGDVVGFATYGQFRGGVGYAHTMEHTVILAETTRGQGIGRALLMAVEDHARLGGAHSMFAGVSCENPHGIAFHTALGYSEIAVLPQVGFKFDRWMDLHLLQKLL